MAGALVDLRRLATPSVWFVAADLNRTLNHGQTVTSWPDRLGRTVTIGGTPRYGNGSQSPNQMPEVVLTAATDKVTVTGNAAFHSNEQIAIWVGRVINAPQVAVGVSQWLFNMTATGASALSSRIDSNGMLQAFWKTSGAPTVANTADLNRPPPCNTPMVVVVRKTATTFEVRINGVEYSTTSSTGTLDTAVAGSLVLGNHPTSPGGTRMAINEFALINGVLTDSQLSRIEQAYLTAYVRSSAIAAGGRVLDSSELTVGANNSIDQARGVKVRYKDGLRHLFACVVDSQTELGILHGTATFSAPDDITWDDDVVFSTARNPAGCDAWYDADNDQWLIFHDDQLSGDICTRTYSGDFTTELSGESVLLTADTENAYRHPCILPGSERHRLYIDHRTRRPGSVSGYTNPATAATSGYGDITVYDWPAGSSPTSGNLSALNGGAAILSPTNVASDWNGHDIGRPDVIRSGGLYWILCDGFCYGINGANTYPHSIAVYVSEDGITGWRSPIDCNPLLSYLNRFDDRSLVSDACWDLYRAEGPAILFAGEPAVSTGDLYVGRLASWFSQGLPTLSEALMAEATRATAADAAAKAAAIEADSVQLTRDVQVTLANNSGALAVTVTATRYGETVQITGATVDISASADLSSPVTAEYDDGSPLSIVTGIGVEEEGARAESVQYLKITLTDAIETRTYYRQWDPAAKVSRMPLDTVAGTVATNLDAKVSLSGGGGASTTPLLERSRPNARVVEAYRDASQSLVADGISLRPGDGLTKPIVIEFDLRRDLSQHGIVYEIGTLVDPPGVTVTKIGRIGSRAVLGFAIADDAEIESKTLLIPLVYGDSEGSPVLKYTFQVVD